MNTTLEQQLEEAQRLLNSYLDLAVDQEDDDAFVARGNGFCDRKYSDDFLQMQVAQLTARIAQLEQEKMKQEI
ncbi:MAG: hypothetical protein IJ524_08270 [Bacteroidales bacterium]|nr:hypothetical protein [Bacteroidales bacterium]